MSTTVGNGLTVDGTVTATGKLGGGIQASNEGDAVLLGSGGKIPTSLIDMDAIVNAVIAALPTAEGGSF